MRTERRRQNDDLCDIAHGYLDRGWQPIPIPSWHKAPREVGWQKLKIKRSNVEQYFSDNESNIGVRLGKASDGLTDVDLDCPEALMLAENFLPRTNAKFGRNSKRAAHWLYYTELGNTERRAVIKYQEPPALGGAVLVELRTGGGDKAAQTLFPPSRHPGGEKITWDNDGKPEEVDGAELKQAVAALATAVLLVRNYPGEGSRHDAALVLGGVLARAQWAANDIDNFVALAAEMAGDAEARERGQSASAAVKKLAQGENMPGLPRLREVWGEPVADTLARWLEIEITDENLSGRIVLPHDEPVKCAREFVNVKFRTADGELRLRFYRGSFYEWIGSHYAEVGVEDMRSQLYEFLDGAATLRNHALGPFKPTATKINTIWDALKSGVNLEYLSLRDQDPPFWVKGAPDRAPPHSLIACRNGLLDIFSGKLHPHTPIFFNTTCLPFDYDPTAPTYPPRWMKFLRQLWPGSDDGKQARQTLQEIFGLMLTAEMRYQKIFLIVGPKRSGKGTIAHVLTALLGRDAVASPTLAGLSTQFGLSPLIDKRAAIIADARLGPQTNSHTIAERLLSISGEDALTIDRKYRDPWTGRLGVRFLILTNELPRISDAAGAIASRFIVLLLSHSFYGREDLRLVDKLTPELPGILNWSLRGAERLRERGHFQMPRASEEAIRTLEDLASPVGAFLRDWCVVGEDETSLTKSLFSAYKHWGELEGHRPGSHVMFGRNLRAVIPQIKTKGHGAGRAYVGVGLSPYGEKKFDDAWQGRS